MWAWAGLQALLCLSWALPLQSAPLTDSFWQPRHIHLSLGREQGSLELTWSTLNYTDQSIVRIKGTDGGEKEYNGTAQKFVDGGQKKLSQWIHRVQLADLKPDAYYFYSVGSQQGWSDLHPLHTAPQGHQWSPSFLLFGDLGTENAVSLPFLQREAEEGNVSAIIHVGDMAYNMFENDGLRGDQFMRQVEPIASLVPYMTCPGNHENKYNFSNYRARFGNSMPRDEGNMFYSFDFGPVHFVSIATEYYYFLNYGTQQVPNQFVWLEKDLSKVNRKVTPWIVLFGHRPMYCTNTDRKDCANFETKTRVGLPINNSTRWGIEDLLFKYGVDVAVWAHEHSYERLFPIYNRTVVPSPDPEEPYVDPRAPVHVTTGSAGCREKHDPFSHDQPSWSAVRSLKYGYTRMKVANSTHLNIEQVDVETVGQPIVDSFWVVQHNHAPFPMPDGKIAYETF